MFVERIRKALGVKTESERMHDFLSQAHDRYHLEYLEREWDRLNKRSRNY
jgi:hypothetical protein